MTRSTGSVSSALAGEGVRAAGHVADQRHPVADDHRLAPQFAGPYRDHVTAVDLAAEPPPVDGQHLAGAGVLVCRPQPAARA
jgi:hypothetical protein